MRVLTLSLLLALGVASPSEAQKSCIEQLEFPEVGRWSEYNAVFKQNEPYTMRYAVVGEESREGKALKWLELRTAGNKKDGDIVYQMLVPGSAAQMSDVHEIVMKHGARPAMKMDGAMVKMISGHLDKQSLLSHICTDVTLVGAETVSVPAGKFPSQHFHSSKYSSDSWVAAGIPFSMVKSVGKDYELTLTRHGEGAKSSITEVPQSMGRGM